MLPYTRMLSPQTISAQPQKTIYVAMVTSAALRRIRRFNNYTPSHFSSETGAAIVMEPKCKVTSPSPRYHFSNELLALLSNFRLECESLVLRDTVEVSIAADKDRKDEKRGAYGKVVELDQRGTIVVGKRLHEIFFAMDVAVDGKRCILQKFFQEINFLKEMDHPSIVRFIGLHYESSGSPIPLLVMEKMEMSLTEYLASKQKGSLPRHQALQILLDVVEGLEYMHEEKQVVHRDLSSNNVLLTIKLRAKIADFGSARFLETSKGWKAATALSTQPGTQDFMPPEALQQNPRYTVSVDVFSFGCVIIHLITHKWPQPVGKTMDARVITEFDRRKYYIRSIDNDDPLLPIIKQCLQDRDRDRPTSQDVKFSLKKISTYTVVLCGPAGSGKSSAANFLLSKVFFPVSEQCRHSRAEVTNILDRNIQVIDTPRIFEFKDKQLIEELSHVATLARNGIHAVVFVLNLKEDISPVYKNAIDHVLQLKGLQPFTFLLCTNAGETDCNSADLKLCIRQYFLAKPTHPSCLKKLVEFVDWRAMVIESRCQTCTVNYQEKKAKEFINMIEMISRNGCKVYMNSYLHFAAKVYEAAQKDKMQQINKALKSHHDKIKQLCSQLATKKSSLFDSKTSTHTDKDVREIEDKIEALKLQKGIACKEILHKTVPLEITIERVRIGMAANMHTIMVKLTATGIIAAVGGGLGALVGSVLPGVGTMYAAAVGASTFAALVNIPGPSSCDDCKVQ